MGCVIKSADLGKSANVEKMAKSAKRKKILWY
jgi:hypothetical protein